MFSRRSLLKALALLPFCKVPTITQVVGGWRLRPGCTGWYNLVFDKGHFKSVKINGKHFTLWAPTKWDLPYRQVLGFSMYQDCHDLGVELGCIENLIAKHFEQCCKYELTMKE